MAHFVAVSRERHRGSRWSYPKSFEQFSKDAVAEVVAAELPRIISSTPVGFIAVEDHFQLVVVLSLTPQRNMFVDGDGRWLIGYIPAVVRSYPFRMVRPAIDAELVLCIDEDCARPKTDSGEGEPFFNTDGSVAAALQQAVDFLVNLERERASTRLAVAALQQAGVIVPWLIRVRDGANEKDVNGLYKIDENALNALSTTSFEKLRAVGALPIAYGQLFSISQLSIFPTLSELHSRIAPKPPAELPDTLDKLFDTRNNDYITFG